MQFIADDNPDKAIEVGSMLIDKIEDLESFPDRGSKFTEYDYPYLYHLSVSHYRIIYHLKFDLEVVEIWRIWHGARGDILLHPPQS